MNAMFDQRQASETATPAMADAGNARIGGWLADHWPKAAIVFGFVMTVVWIALLVWLIGVVVGLV
jgi:hypothetical protein